MAECVTCGRQLHPARAEKYDYCTDRECQKRNATPLEIVAIGVNKAADQYQVLDRRTREKVETGEWAQEMATGTAPEPAVPDHAERQAPARPRPKPEGRAKPKPKPGPQPGAKPKPEGRAKPKPEPSARPWTRSQQDLAALYSARGMRPDEIAARLGLSVYTVTQMILEARNRAKP